MQIHRNQPDFILLFFGRISVSMDRSYNELKSQIRAYNIYTNCGHRMHSLQSSNVFSLLLLRNTNQILVLDILDCNKHWLLLYLQTEW